MLDRRRNLNKKEVQRELIICCRVIALLTLAIVNHLQAFKRKAKKARQLKFKREKKAKIQQSM